MENENKENLEENTPETPETAPETEKTAETPAIEPAPAAETPAEEPSLEIPAEPVKEKAKTPSVKLWIVLTTLLFFFSSLSAVYIIVSGGACKKVSAESGFSARRAVPSVASLRNEPHAAIIKIRGMIAESQRGQSASSIAKRIKTASENKHVKAIILDIDSPGGTVASVQEIYQEILNIKKEKNIKFIAMFRDTAASGAFYIAMACDKVIAQPGTLTGSIGVIMQTTNVEGLMDKIGVKVSSVKSGAHKDLGSPFRSLTPEEQAMLQALIDDVYGQFFDAVKTARPKINPEDLKTYADGRIFTGRQAFKLGLIDGLGGEDAATQAAAELTGIKGLKAHTVTARENFFTFLMDFDPSANSKALGNEIEAMASPKLAYLWTL